MTPQLAPTHQTAPAAMPDPVTQAGLAELFQLALTVARASACLADLERQSIEALTEAAVEATRKTIGQAGTVAEAAELQLAAHTFDQIEPMRDAITRRLAIATDSFDQGARAARRTAALQARLAEGRPLRAPEPGRERSPAGGANGAATRPANDTDRAERMDDPEWGDEIAGRSDEDVMRDIRRDLAAAGAGPAQGEPPPGPAPLATRPGPARARPKIVHAAPQPPNRPEGLPEPDT